MSSRQRVEGSRQIIGQGRDLICEENGICTEFLSAEVFDSAHHHQKITSVVFRKAGLFLCFAFSDSFGYVDLKNVLMSPHLSFYDFP